MRRPMFDCYARTRTLRRLPECPPNVTRPCLRDDHPESPRVLGSGGTRGFTARARGPPTGRTARSLRASLAPGSARFSAYVARLRRPHGPFHPRPAAVVPATTVNLNTVVATLWTAHCGGELLGCHYSKVTLTTQALAGSRMSEAPADSSEIFDFRDPKNLRFLRTTQTAPQRPHASPADSVEPSALSHPSHNIGSRPRFTRHAHQRAPTATGVQGGPFGSPVRLS